MTTKKEVPVGLRLTREVKAALDEAAADSRRPVASYIELLLIDNLTENGYLKTEGSPKTKGKGKA